MSEKFFQPPSHQKPKEEIAERSGSHEDKISTMSVVERKDYTAEERKERHETYTERMKLADEVCLKYNKGDSFNFSLEKLRSSSPLRSTCILTLDGAEIGNFLIRPGEDGEDKIMGFIFLNKNIRDKGFGKVLYRLLNEYLKNSEGSILKQSYETNGEADALWLSLFKDGFVEVVPPTTRGGRYKIPGKKNSFLPTGTKLYRFKK